MPFQQLGMDQRQEVQRGCFLQLNCTPHEHSLVWSTEVDLNHRLPAYQADYLTTDIPVDERRRQESERRLE